MEELTGSSTLQEFLTKLEFLEQFADRVVDYSSKYNSKEFFAYSPENLTGKPVNFPAYGDFSNSFMLRTYGNWWRDSEGAQKNYMPQDEDPVDAEDFITVNFNVAVVPISIHIYETYNPGAVVRIYARNSSSDYWKILYESKAEDPLLLAPNTARCFKPVINKSWILVDEIRLEFNTSRLLNQMGLDGILLAGYKPETQLQQMLILKGLLLNPELPVMVEKPEKSLPALEINNRNYFDTLPYELIALIFQYLDLKSLLRCASVSKRWQSATLDPAIYQNLSLKRHWTKVDNRTLLFFQKRSSFLKKLDLSWCGNNSNSSEEAFNNFLRSCGTNLTHLALNNCQFIKDEALREISERTELQDLRLRNCICNPASFIPLNSVRKLISLDLYASKIDDESLISILKSNRDLKHLIIDFCENLSDMDAVAETVSIYNRQLVTLSSWKVLSLSAHGVRHLARCSELRELDLGWCLMMQDPENCLERIAEGCPNLRRLIISGWSGVTNNHLLPLIQTCKEMVQLDVLSNIHISDVICDWILSFMPKLRLLDISFCYNIKPEHLVNWRIKYPNVTIQYQSFYYENIV